MRQAGDLGRQAARETLCTSERSAAGVPIDFGAMHVARRVTRDNDRPTSAIEARGPPRQLERAAPVGGTLCTSEREIPTKTNPLRTAVRALRTKINAPPPSVKPLRTESRRLAAGVKQFSTKTAEAWKFNLLGVVGGSTE